VRTDHGKSQRGPHQQSERFKALARIGDYSHRNHISWEISGHRIASGVLDELEIAHVPDEIDPFATFTEWASPQDGESFRYLADRSRHAKS
jgi:hypothetical protein